MQNLSFLNLLNRNLKIMQKYVHIVLFLLAALTLSGYAVADVSKVKENDATEDRHPLQLRSDEVMEYIFVGDLELKRLREQLALEEGEAKDSLFLRVTQRAIKQLSDYSDMTALILKQQEAGLNTDTIIAELRSKMLPLGPRIRRAISNRERDMDAAAKDEEPLSAKSLQLLEERNRFSDLAYQALSRHSHNLELLNFNNRETSEYLSSAIYARAESLAGQIQIASTQKARADSASVSIPDDVDLKVRARAAQRKLDSLTDSLRITIDLMSENNIDSALYRQLLIRTTGELTTDILKPEILMGLIGNWFDRSLIFIKKYSTEIVFKGLMFFGLLLMFYYLSKLTGKLIRKGLKKANVRVSVLMEEMLVSMAARIVFFMGILIALGQMGVSLAPVLAGLGVAGFIIGFALQDTLGNFASGMMILIYRPFDVGDMIETGSVKGNVRSMNLVSTTILTIDHQTLVIPNNKIWGDVINNLTAQKLRRVDMLFGVGYSENTARVDTILNDILDQHPLVLDKPERLVKLHTLGESSVDFIVRPWVKTDDYWDVYWDITRAVKDRFDEEGISIPFPQRDVHLYKHSIPEAKCETEDAVQAR